LSAKVNRPVNTLPDDFYYTKAYMFLLCNPFKIDLFMLKDMIIIGNIKLWIPLKQVNPVNNYYHD